MPDLVGREPELARLRRAIAQAAGGAGGLVLVSGEAGIGKTSLLAAAVGGSSSPLTAVWGTAREDSGMPGLWPWVEVLRTCQDAGLLGEAAGEALLSSPEGERFGVFDAVGRTLRQVAATHPLAVVLDDLHWADAGTLRLLRFLLPDLSRSHLLVLGAFRDDEPDGSARDLLAGIAARADVLALRRLGRAQVGRLVAQLSPGADAASIHRRSGGNPFLVRQLADLGEAEEAPGPVCDLLRRRLDRLGATCLDLMQTAAVAGGEVELTLLARAVGRPYPEVIADVDAAVAARVVERSGAEALRFTHDLFRECLYGGLNSLARAGHHARVAQALADQAGANPGELAHHFVCAYAVTEPVAAIPHLRHAAAQATSVLAFEAAAAHLTEGVRLAQAAGESALRRELLLDLADAHHQAGDLEPARRSFLAAADDARAAGDAPALSRAALGVHHIGAPTWSGHDEAISLLEEALAAGGAEDARTARLLAALARELAHGPPNRPRALAVSEQAVALARRLPDPATLAECLLARHDAVWAPGTARLRLDVLDEAARAAADASEPGLAWDALFGRFVALLELADPEAHDVFRRLAQWADRLGQPHRRWLVLSRRAVLAMLAGRLDDAEAFIDEVAVEAERLGEPDGPAVLGDLRTQLALLRGQPLPPSQLWGRPDEPPRWMLAQFEAIARLSAGEPVMAVQAVRDRLGETLAGSRGWQTIGAVAVIADAAAAAGDAGLAAQAYDVLRPHAGEIAMTGGAINVVGPISRLLGLLAATLGDRDGALAHLDDALATAQRLDCHAWVAQISYEKASLLGDSHPGSEAMTLLQAAANAAQRLGLARLARDAGALLAAGAAPPNVFRREGEVWTLAFGGEVVAVPHAKGLRDIAQLLAAPGQDVLASQLVGAVVAAEAATGADPVLDDTARAEYRRRLDQLSGEIDAADRAGDAARSSRALAERDELVRALSAAHGLGRRSRRLGDATERARKTVTARIRDSLARIAACHPALGRHLSESIITGTFCAYRPKEPTRWQL